MPALNISIVFLKLCPYRLRHLDVSQLRSTQPSASEIGLLKAHHSPAELSATSGTATESASAATKHQAAHQCQVVRAPATWLSLIHQPCASLTAVVYQLICTYPSHFQTDSNSASTHGINLNPWYSKLCWNALNKLRKTHPPCFWLCFRSCSTALAPDFDQCIVDVFCWKAIQCFWKYKSLPDGHRSRKPQSYQLLLRDFICQNLSVMSMVPCKNEQSHSRFRHALLAFRIF